MSRFGWKSPSPSRAGNTSSSIRGKISAPIPIPDDDDEFPIRPKADDDDEFPIRSSGVSLATPLGHEGAEKQLRLSSPPPIKEVVAKSEEEQPIPESMVPSRSPPEIPNEPRLSYEIPNRQTTEVNLGLVARDRISHPKPALGKPERKKSTLKSVLGRLFGKKRKSGGSESNKPTKARHEQHHSDPTALRGIKEVPSQHRSNSMPITEYNRALRSHSIIKDASVNLDRNRSSGSPADARTRPRRATTPSRLYTPTGGPGKDWGLAPRPPSGHVRTSHSFGDLTGGIGYAISSENHSNRRSRSLYHLRGDPGPEDNVRRRSDEIRYWRESYDPDALSLRSSQKPEGEPTILVDDNELISEPEPQPPPQPFNFGPMGEMAGMKITQAASLESRVSRLEERLEKMERIVGILQHSSSSGRLNGSKKQKSWNRPGTDSSELSLPQHNLYQQTHNPQVLNQAQQENSRPSTMSTHQSDHQAYDELSPRPIYISSPEQTPQTARIPSNGNLSVSHLEAMSRPLSTSTTIRGIASSSPDQSSFPLSKHGSLTAHHYSALFNLIQAETAARQQLEAQVVHLQRQLHAALGGVGDPYPTPSPDFRVHEDHDNDTTQSSIPLDRSLDLDIIPPGIAFSHAHTNSDGMLHSSSFEHAHPQKHDHSHNDDLSMSDYEPDGESKEKEFLTPREELRGFGGLDASSEDGAGGFEAEEKGDRALKTLSLSQLTYQSGKRGQDVPAF